MLLDSYRRNIVILKNKWYSWNLGLTKGLVGTVCFVISKKAH